jgi:DNA replication and repair protein RecF
MKLDLVQIQHLRNLQNVSISPSHNLNFIVGENGSGKSSILEAVHYLGFGRSFRTAKHKNVIQHQQDAFTVFCECKSDTSEFKLGISRQSNDSFQVSVNGLKSTRVSDLVSNLPVQIFTPQSSDILLGAPKLRRKYLDWSLFHVEPLFYSCSGNYQKLLKHNNALLKVGKGDDRQASYWNGLLLKYGEELTEYRQMLVKQLIPLITVNLAKFLPEFFIEISYYRGWEKGNSLADSISRNEEKDRRNGFISVGPHKADIKFRINGIAAHEVLSRGQLRMLVAALQLASTQYLMSHTHKTSVFLLDDVGAELDAAKREVFIDMLLESNAQLFVTAIEQHQIDFIDKYQDKKMFHVEHGQVREEI